MSDNKFAPPASTVADVSLPVEVSDATLKKIRIAWMAGCLSTVFTLGVTLLAINGAKLYGFSGWELIDVALMAGLTFGIYKKSRACAVTMFIYFVYSKVVIVMRTGEVSGLVLGLLFLYFYGQGVVGTFAYRKALRERDASAPGPLRTGT